MLDKFEVNLGTNDDDLYLNLSKYQKPFEILPNVKHKPEMLIDDDIEPPKLKFKPKKSNAETLTTKTTINIKSKRMITPQTPYTTLTTKSPIIDKPKRITTPQTSYTTLTTESPITEKPKPIIIPVKKAVKTVNSTSTSKANPQLEMQKYIAKVEAEKTKQAKIRTSTVQEHLQNWHKQQDESISNMQTIYSNVQNLLEMFETFSADSYYKYIKQFASSQIELFNLIHEHYEQQSELAAKSMSNDYYNAVDNYTLYLEKIIYSLASFGVAEIVSESGTPINNKIHDIINKTNAKVVKKSLRSGFIYKDTVLQKELIET